MRFAVAFTTCLFLIFGVYGTREDGLTSDIDWNKLTGTWFLAVATKFSYWTTVYKCHIFAPYNITDKGMQVYFYNIPEDSGSDDASGFVEDVIFGPGGWYTVHDHINKQWIAPIESIGVDEKVNVKEDLLTDEQKWAVSHRLHFSTNYKVVISQLKFRQGPMGMWIWTRNQHINAEKAVELMDLARNEGANQDLELKHCGDVAPQQYFKST